MRGNASKFWCCQQQAVQQQAAAPTPSAPLTNNESERLCRFMHCDCCCRYVFAFQMPWLPEAHIAANDYDFLRAAFTEEPFGVQTPGMFTEEVRPRPCPLAASAVC